MYGFFNLLMVCLTISMMNITHGILQVNIIIWILIFAKLEKPVSGAPISNTSSTTTDFASSTSNSSDQTNSITSVAHRHRPRATTVEISQKQQMEASNISQILDSLVKNYDKRLRPNYGGEPVEVGVTIHVSSISAVSEVDMDFTIDFYLRQFWKDPRLSFNGTLDSLTVSIDMVKDIWVPDTFFPNERKSFFHIATTHNSFLRISPTGEILRSLRLTVTAVCPMDLKYFPLDRQNCSLELESYGYSAQDIRYRWKVGDSSVSVDEGVNLAQFTVVGHNIVERMISLSTGNYSRLSLHLSFARNVGFYLIQIYLPSSLIVIISWVSFWLNREATQARVAIGVTTVLTMTTLMTSTNSSMPKVSYAKSIDIYLGTCFIIVFASLLEYAAVGYLLKRVRMKKEKGKTGQGPGPVMNMDGSTGYEASFRDSSFRKHDSVRLPQKVKMPNLPGYPVNMTNAIELQPLGPSSLPRRQVVPYPVAMDHAPGSSIPLPLECDCDIEMAAAANASSFRHHEPLRLRPKYKKYKKFRPSSIDKYSRIFFPLTFTFFHLIYWTIYLDAVDVL